MEIAYCERWWLSRKRAVNPMSESEARKRHDARQPYVALLGGDEAPRFIVDLAERWVSVDFLDRQMRKYLSFNFKELLPGRLFLKTAHFWEYKGDSNSEYSNKIFSFDEGGHMVVAEQDSTTGEMREFESSAPVDENWERYPPFGDYLSLCKEERARMAQKQNRGVNQEFQG